MRCKI